MAKENGMDFSHLLAYCTAGGAFLGIMAAMFLIREYTLDTGLIVGAVAGVAFAAVVGSAKGQV